MAKLKTKFITIEVETDVPNKAFTRAAMQMALDEVWFSDEREIITVRTVLVDMAQAPKK